MNASNNRVNFLYRTTRLWPFCERLRLAAENFLIDQRLFFIYAVPSIAGFVFDWAVCWTICDNERTLVILRASHQLPHSCYRSAIMIVIACHTSSRPRGMEHIVMPVDADLCANVCALKSRLREVPLSTMFSKSFIGSFCASNAYF